MYEPHFSLNELPFGLTPDTNYFFASSNYQEALNTLLVAVRNGEGFIKITGEVGNGKTMLCQKFLTTLDEHYIIVYISHPCLDPHYLLLSLAGELGIPIDDDMDRYRLIKLLTKKLLGYLNDNKRVIVCLDEAQAISLESLEALRLLTNLETEKYKLLQVVLFGQPELNEHLADKSMRQLRQRITFQYHLGGLYENELAQYLNHRLNTAGYSGSSVFSKEAVHIMYRMTRGVPRLINVIAHKSLLLAYGEGVREVLPQHIKQAAADTQEARDGWLTRWKDGFAYFCQMIHQRIAGFSLINKMLQDLEKRGRNQEDLGRAGTFLRAVPNHLNSSQAWLYTPLFLLLVTGGIWVSMTMSSETYTFIQHKPNLVAQSAPMLDISPEHSSVPSSELLSAHTQKTLPLLEAEWDSTPIPKVKPETIPTRVVPVRIIPESKPVRLAQFVEVATVATNQYVEPAGGNTTAAGPIVVASTADKIAGLVASIKRPSELALSDHAVKKMNSQQRAEQEFQKAVILMQQGKISQALEKCSQVLQLNAMHEAARQTMVSLLLKRKRLDEVEPILLEGIRINSGQARFAKILSRIQVERGDVNAALDTLQYSLPKAFDQADYRAFIGALLQRLARHQEAIEHYLAAVNLSPTKGIWLMGLGISLQEEGHFSEAHEAFIRAQMSDDLNKDLQAFVDLRIRQTKRKVY